MRILIVEDEPRVAGFLRRGLREEGWVVALAATAEAALERAADSVYDVIVLDVVLPGDDGFEVARRLRGRGDRTPILMLTALDAREDVVRGLDLGADDYLTKPFDFDELLARLRALTRRSTGETATILQWDDVVLDRIRREVRRGERALDLTPTEFRVLEIVMEAGGRVVSRGELLERAWGLDFDPGTGVVDVHLANLRAKLEAENHPRILETVRGAGFRLGGSRGEDPE